MARARNIKPALFKNELLGVADPDLMILFVGLWCLADREGRLEDRPLRIKAEIFPYRAPDVNRYLTDLDRLGFIQRYEAGDEAYIQVCKFTKHQSPHKTERPSDIPKPPIKSDSCLSTVKAPLNNGSAHVKESLIPDSLIPDSGLSDSLNPDSLTADQPLAPPKRKKRAPSVANEKTAAIWDSYSKAYYQRYSVDPIRNAKVNGQIQQLSQRLGDDAPHVAAYYVSHGAQWYVSKGHAVGQLLADAEKLHTEWRTGSQITHTTARLADRTSHTAGVFQQLIAEERAKQAQQESTA